MKRRVFSCFLLLLFFLLTVFTGCDINENTSIDSSKTARILDDGYGVLKGDLISHELEPAEGEGRWTHYMLFVRAGGFTYRCAINVVNRQGAILYRSIPFMNMSQSGGIFGLPDGFHDLAMNSTSGAIDYIRHQGILDIIKDHPWSDDNLILNNTQVPVVESLLSNVRKIYVFGEPFSDGSKGVHCIHQNQGNMSGTEFALMNGAWQDGVVIVEYPDIIRYVDRWIKIGGIWRKIKMPIFIPNRRIFMTRFAVQRDFTHSNGNGYNAIVSTGAYSGFAKTVTRHYGPYNCEQLEVALNSGMGKSGSAEIFVKKGSAPTTSSYDAKGTKFIKMYGNGSYYVMVRSKSRIIYVPPLGPGVYIYDWHSWSVKISRK